MIKCGLPLMSNAILGGTPLPHNLTTLSGVFPPPSITYMVFQGHSNGYDAGGETPPTIGNVYYPQPCLMSPHGGALPLAPLIETHLVPMSHHGEAQHQVHPSMLILSP